MPDSARRACLLAALALSLGCEIGVEHPTTAGSSSAGEEPAAAHVARGRLEFVDGYAAGLSAASQSGKPMMLFFTAEWCEFCKQMAAEAFVDPQVVQLSRQFVCVLVDADLEPGVCRQFAVTGYPTVQFATPRGVPLARVVGKKPGREVTSAMQNALRQVARRGGADRATR